MIHRSARHKVAAAASVVVGLLLVATAASAHVEITADGSPGSDGVLLTSVFAENECSGTIATVDLAFPDSPDLTTATTAEVDGWTSAVTKRTGSESVSDVVWTNTAAVKGDGEFSLAIGPITDGQKSIEFKGIVTCADGEIFRWIEKGEKSEFPAPVLTLAKASADTADHAHDEATTDTKAAATTADKKDDGMSTGVLITIVTGAMVLIFGGIVLVRRKK